MATTQSAKALSNLVCEASVRASEAVLRQELERNLDLLSKGVLAYDPPSQKSAEEFAKKRGVAGKLSTFIKDLSQITKVEEEKSKQLLSIYLSGDFRGTKTSLKKLIHEDRFQKPLLVDIWQFYRAERLYILRILKGLLSIICSPEEESDEHFKVFKDIYSQLVKKGLYRSLLDQLKSVIEEPLPTRESHGRHFTSDLQKSWLHFNLREQLELLQIFFLYTYSDLDKTETDPEQLIQLFTGHGFGTKSRSLLDGGADPLLIDAIGAIESLLIVYLLDLPGLTGCPDLKSHPIWSSESMVANLDRSINSRLGNLNCHAPILLAWMLSHYLVDGTDSLVKFKALGDRSINSLSLVNYLKNCLENEALNSNKIVRGLSYGVVYSLISILITAFDPERMGLYITDLMVSLLKEEAISLALWKQGLDQGLGSHLAYITSKFPAEIRPTVMLCASLASANTESSEHVLNMLQSRPIYAEACEEVPPGQVSYTDLNMVLREPHVTAKGITLPRGTKAVVSNSNSKFYYWQTDYNGLYVLQGQLELLLSQVSRGLKNVQSETLWNTVHIAKLFEILFKNTSTNVVLKKSVYKSLLLIIEKFSQISNPPTELLANSLNCMKVIQEPVEVWQNLSETGVFPRFDLNNINPGLVGSLLAQQECVEGSYPLTTAFLDLLLDCAAFDTLSASVQYVIKDILPHFDQWRFNLNKERQIFGQKVLKVCKKVVHTEAAKALMAPAPNQTLLAIAATGDRVIQSCYEAQATLETGLGVELSKMVNLALEVVNLLLKRPAAEAEIEQSCLKSVLCSPPLASKPHFLITIAQYVYHVQSCDVPRSAIELMATVAEAFPMSLLACLGTDAEAIRDILIHRLESKTEDVRLKVAILQLFTACVESQPGLIQLFIGVSDDEVAVISEQGCLSSVMGLLENIDNQKQQQPPQSIRGEELHVAVVEFVFSLWSHQRILAVAHLKKQPNFWPLLTGPLFDKKYGSSSSKVKGCILRILSSEVYTSQGKEVDKNLITILDKLFDEKANYFATFLDFKDDPFLLGSWKTFLVIVSKDQPVSVSPVVCHSIASSLVKAIRGHLAQTPSTDNGQRMLTSLSETCLILMQRWQTKSAGESMEDWCKVQARLLAEAVANYEVLHPRCRAAIIAVASTALKSSSCFKMHDDVLNDWLLPACILTEKSLTDSASSNNEHVGIMALSLLRNLLQRLPDSVSLVGTLHERSLILGVLSTTHHCIRTRSYPDLVQASLSLLLAVAKRPWGCSALLSSDLSQLLWLPLSCLGTPKAWLTVFLLSIQLAVVLLREGKQHALENSITVVSLLQDQLTAFLLAIKDSVQPSQMELTATTASFLSMLMGYYKQWQLHHAQSLAHFYRAMISSLHTSVCLLIRPSLLSLLVGKKKESPKSPGDSEIERVRRLSSTDQADLEHYCPELIRVQNKLLDVLSSCLRMLITLSPDLVALVTSDIVDYAAYEHLLQIAFSTPTFEQDESQGLSYGTVISICNLCIRIVTKTDRSPSPGRSSTTTLASLTQEKSTTMDRKRLILVLEQSLTVLIAQAFLCLSDERLSPREKQLLRRELGAELGSVTESMRRYIHKGTRPPQTTTTVSSPGSASASSRLAKSDEQFMKFISVVVQKVFK